ncbi:hypothetical protein OHA21_51580 [Actinoplanes sp. NBC_00393]|uniref:hypothetical protein n=1 Tax=Actinoplanes sp. NBC_00393 TaxID=2975953 RepID=UPI002E22ECAB
MRGNVAAAALQRIARLLVMIGLGLAAYFALSLLDHAAHADEGLGNADPLASVEKAVADVGEDRAVEGPVSRVVARKAVPLKAAVKERTKPAEKQVTSARKTVDKPVVSARKVVEKRAVSVRKVAEKPREVVEKPVASVRKVIDRPVVSARKVVDHVVSASGVKERKLLRAARTARAAVAEVIERAPSAGPPQALPSPAPQALPGPAPKAPPRPSPEAAAESPVSPAAMPTATAMTPSLPPAVVFEPEAPRFGCDGTEPAGVQDDQPGLTSAPSTPEPQSPPDPNDQSLGAAHARDSGGGNAPPAGIVPSSWWPDLPAAARSLPTDANTPGRSVRYCGPPS